MVVAVSKGKKKTGGKADGELSDRPVDSDMLTEMQGDVEPKDSEALRRNLAWKKNQAVTSYNNYQSQERSG